MPLSAPLDLSRTFSKPRDGLNDFEHWFEAFSRDKGEFQWATLHEWALCVVLGEAGIGKTTEFRSEVNRLNADGKFAVLIPLNELANNEAWTRILADADADFARWAASGEPGYFFLDAVDEARLVNHAAFVSALSVARVNLRPHLARSHIAISSRISDWGVPDVKAAIEERLRKPLLQARRNAQPAAADAQEKQVSPQHVVCLDPLSRKEARRLANAFEVDDPDGFWTAVEEGEYEFMATRPLDLEWMVTRWNRERNLGTYTKLLDGNIDNRLLDVNPTYRAANAVLAPAALRRGAEELAAACEFQGAPFIAVGERARAGEIDPAQILPDWRPADINRLVNAALFDEATFGRVKFHHRSAREYLAACWANRMLRQGVPRHDMLSLFHGKPFGEPVLVPTRRAVLCWLATLNADVRAWLTANFPEMYLFEGDPAEWDPLNADRAFSGAFERVKNGLRSDWINSGTEFGRVARRLSPGFLAHLAEAQPVGSPMSTYLFPYIQHGQIADCAAIVFGMYQNAAAREGEKRRALMTLRGIATAEQRATVGADMRAGRLGSNELISAALSLVDWRAFAQDELAGILRSSRRESGFGGGPMARVVKERLLPEANAQAAQHLLGAIVAALPQPEGRRRYGRFPEDDQPEHAWLLDVLPVALERVLDLLPRDLASFPQVVLDAAEQVEANRDTGYVDTGELSRLHAVIQDRPGLRWRLALEIAQSEEITFAASRLTWGGSCLVTLRQNDMPEILSRANDPGVAAGDQDIWFHIALTIAWRDLRGSARREALRTLISGPQAEARAAESATVGNDRLHSARSRQEHGRQQIARKREISQDVLALRERLRGGLQDIANGSDRRTLFDFIIFSFNHGGRDLTAIDLPAIVQQFGQEAADAVAEGLIAFWRSLEPANPADHDNGHVDMSAMAGLCALDLLVRRGTDLSTMSAADTARAARLAVWENNTPPDWFGGLAAGREAEVLAALQPWIERDALAPAAQRRMRGGLDLAMRCETELRRRMLMPLVPRLAGLEMQNGAIEQSLLDVLLKDNAIDLPIAGAFCTTRTETTLDPASGRIVDAMWFRLWLDAEPGAAWRWLLTLAAGLGDNGTQQLRDIAGTIGASTLINPPIKDANVPTLVEIWRLYRPLRVDAGQPLGPPSLNGDGVAGLLQSIPMVLSKTSGRAAAGALQGFVATEADPEFKQWLQARVMDQAAAEAQLRAGEQPLAFRTISAPYLSPPATESQLFQQNMGRLRDIRTMVEEGPFSDRGLFPGGVAEKHLQTWLAGRLKDTPNIGFGVHREEEVDADNRTDIQLSCAKGNVCNEIKPLDRERGYSANSLVGTLRNQIVGQYLKGLNSAHGILVLMRLDDKKWDVPDVGRDQEFEVLVTYLQQQAALIKAENPHVAELEVFAIDCLRPIRK